MGEGLVSSKLQQLNKERYRVINNLMLPSGGNTSNTQIDHVVVSNYGVFCIETKSHQGWIFGNGKQRYWTHVLFNFKSRFFNPVHQNYCHVKAIESNLSPSFPEIPVIPFTVFPLADTLTLRDVEAVGKIQDMIKYIESHRRIFYLDEQRDAIYQMLVDKNVRGSEARVIHYEEVSSLVKTRQDYNLEYKSERTAVRSRT